MQTISIIWDAMAESSCRLPYVLIDICAAYAQMSDLRALYHVRRGVCISSEYEKISFVLTFDDPLCDVGYVCTAVGWPMGTITHHGSVCLALDPSLQSVLEECNRHMARVILGKKWIDDLVAIAHSYLNR